MLKKKLVSVLLAMAMVLGLGGTAFAVEPAQVRVYQTSFAEGSTRAEIIKNTVQHTNEGRNGRYTTGSALVVYNPDTDAVFYMIPIFEGDTCISMIHMSQDLDVGVTRTSNTVPYEKVMALPAGDYILYVTGGVLYAESANRVIELQNRSLSIPGNEAYLALSYQEKAASLSTKAGNECALTSVDALQSAVFEVTVGATFPDGIMPYTEVPEREVATCNITNFVKQANSKLCGLACVATIVNYKEGLNLSSVDIANLFGIEYEASGFQGVQPSKITEILNNYSLSYSLQWKLSWSVVKKDINAKYPFIADVVYGKDTANETWHSLVVYGYECAYGDSIDDADTRYIFVSDPQTSHRLYVKYNNPTMTLAGYTYTWEESISRY